MNYTSESIRIDRRIFYELEKPSPCEETLNSHRENFYTLEFLEQDSLNGARFNYRSGVEH